MGVVFKRVGWEICGGYEIGLGVDKNIPDYPS